MKKCLEEVNLQKEFNNATFTLLVSCISLSVHAVLAMPLFLCQEDKTTCPPIHTSVSKIVQPVSDLRFAVASPSTCCSCCNSHTSCTIPALSAQRENLAWKPCWMFSHSCCSWPCVSLYHLAHSLIVSMEIMIGNITLQELGKLVQSQFVFTTFPAYTDVSRYVMSFSLYGLVRFFSLLSDRHGL